MSSVAVSMPHAYDNAGKDISNPQYLDILKHSQKDNARHKTGDYSASPAGELSDSHPRQAETRKNSTTSSGTNPKAKKRLKKGNVLPRLVEHLKIKDRSNSVPVLFPPIPPNSGNPQLWRIEDADKAVSSPREQASHVGEPQSEKTVKIVKKIKLPMPPKFALYRRLGSKGGENFYKAPEKLMEGHGKHHGASDRKRPGHSVTLEKRKASLAQALTQSYDNFNFPRVMQTSGDDNGSVSKKIEQFRRWHEEQYKEKLARIKAETTEKYKKDKTKLMKWNSMDEIDQAKNISIEFTSREPTVTGILPFITIPDDPIKLGKVVESGKRRSPSPPARVPEELLARPPSTGTWKTWRDVNESDAYDNVKQYIEENELMSDEKRKHIEKWVLEVDRCRSEKSPDSILHLADSVIPEENSA